MEAYCNTMPAKMTRGNDATTVLRNSKAPIKTDGSTSKTDNRRSANAGAARKIDDETEELKVKRPQSLNQKVDSAIVAYKTAGLGDMNRKLLASRLSVRLGMLNGWISGTGEPPTKQQLRQMERVLGLSPKTLDD